MLDLLKIDDNVLSQTMRLLKAEFVARGWNAEIPYAGSQHVFIDRGDDKTIHIFNSAPPTTSFAAGLLANDKYGVYELMRKNGVLQPDTIMVSAGKKDSLEKAKNFLTEHSKVVVKPLDGGHGNGVAVGINTEEKLKNSIFRAAQYNRGNSSRVIIQKMLDGDLLDIRIMCINYEFAGAINRVPAGVIGDGEHTIAELIEIENNTIRGKAYHAKLARINLDEVSRYLGDEIEKIPASGVEARVLGVANYGRGGKLIDVTDDIPEWMRHEAELAAKSCGLAVCGVDYLTDKIGKDSMRDSMTAYLIEVNKSPILSIHDMPTVGKNRNVVRKFVDYLDTMESK